MKKEHKRWMNRLKKCLKEMPEDCEVVVAISTYNKSDVTLLPRGTFERELEKNRGDAICLQLNDFIIDEFLAENVVSNSESI